MTAQEIFAYLTQDAGLDSVTADAIMKASANEKVASRAAQLRQSSEFTSIEQRAQALEAKLKGTKEAPGAEAYETWYRENWQHIQKLNTDAIAYRERYGELDAPKTPPAAQVFDEAAIAKLVDARIQSQYGPQWSSLLKGSGQIIERHMRGNRKDNLDWDKISEIAAAKGGDLNAAYEEWDKPAAEAARQAATEAEIERRVKTEVAKRSTQSMFPAGADATPSGGISPLSRNRAVESGAPKYDRSKVIESAVTGKYQPETVQ